jgi:LacI family transcriptional regulator
VQRRTTIKDVARRAGVSLGTASRALSDSPAVSKASRGKVLQAAAELDYVPNAQAQSLRSSRTGTIGLLVSDIRNPFFAELAHEIEDCASADDVVLHLGDAGESVERQEHWLQMLLRQRTDGLIISPQGDGGGALTSLAASGLPAVFVDREVPGLGIPSVTSDPEPGIGAAVAHLSHLGHHRVGYIGGPLHASTARERFDAFRAAVALYDLSPEPGLMAHGDFREESGAQAVSGLLEAGATALLVADGPMTVGAVGAVRERGLRIGADVDLVAFDDHPLFRFTDPPLTAVAQDIPRLARLSFTMLRDVEAGRDPRSVRIPTSLRIRSSTHRLDPDNRLATRTAAEATAPDQEVTT